MRDTRPRSDRLPPRLMTHLLPRRWARGLRVVAAISYRQRWRAVEGVRRHLWPERWGFVRRRLPAVEARVSWSSEAVPSRGPARLAFSHTARVGDVGGPQSIVAECARLAGLDVRQSAGGDVEELAHRATRERWPVLALAGTSLAAAAGATLAPFLWAGGTLLVTGVTPAAAGELERLANELGVSLPTCRWLPAGRSSGVRFSEAEAPLTRELGGVWFGSAEATAFLTATGEGVLAWTGHPGGERPVAWTGAVAGGKIVLSTGATELVDRTEAKWGRPLAVLPPLMVLRACYGQVGWHAPWALANVTIDDPTLDEGPLGLDYRRMARLAREHDFHVTVATIPRELGLADPEVLRLLRVEEGRLSACYHGNDHDSYEFYQEVRRHRFPARPLPEQRRKLTQAAARGTSFAARSGLALDRVMVLPHGLCSAALLPQLHDLGFLASCNAVDRYPLGCAEPPDHDTGALPADLGWAGFPLLGRRPLVAAGEFALDAFLGKPTIAFTHRREVGRGLEPLLELAANLWRFSGRRLRWCGLEDLARHAYLVRRCSSHRWEVLMTANEACLHNPAAEPRVFRVLRPKLPTGNWLQANGPATPSANRELVEVTVPPYSTVEVGVQRGTGGAALPRATRGRCSL
jgi:hypothetical protein